MPKSPPKAWWDEMYQEVKSGNPDYSEEQVRKTVGDIWYHKMSPAKKKKEVKKSEGAMRVEAINYTKNDKGEDVIAIGAPGSLARAKVEFPALIEELNALPDGTPIEEVTSRIKQADPTGGNMEQDSILQATKFYQAASLRVSADDVSFGKYPPMSDEDMNMLEALKKLEEIAAKYPAPVVISNPSQNLYYEAMQEISSLYEQSANQLASNFDSVIENIEKSSADEDTKSGAVHMAEHEFWAELINRLYKTLGKDTVDELVYEVDPREIQQKNEWINKVMKTSSKIRVCAEERNPMKWFIRERVLRELEMYLSMPEYDVQENDSGGYSVFGRFTDEPYALELTYDIVPTSSVSMRCTLDIGIYDTRTNEPVKEEQAVLDYNDNAKGSHPFSMVEFASSKVGKYKTEMYNLKRSAPKTVGSLMRVCASDRSEVVSGAANALWATAWADEMDELGLSSHLSGTEITEVMPPIPQEAHVLAEKLIERIETTNAISFDTFVLPGFEEGEVFDGDNLGWYLAMESMGHGVAWTDNHAEDHGLKTPYFENYELSDVARAQIEKEYADEIEEVASMTAKTAQQSFAFPNLFSSEAKRWIVTEVKRRAAEHAKTSASPEQTVAFIDKAADEVAAQLSNAVSTEVESILDPDTKEKIYNEISVPQSDVGLPAAPQVGAPEEMAPVAASARVYMSPKLRIAFEKAADGFMQEQIEEGTWVQIDGHMGTEWIPADLVDLNEVNGLIKQLETGKQVDLTNTSLKDYSENKEAFYLEVIHGFGARLSAPGYMDKTEWTVFETKEQAAEHLKEMYGDEGIEEEGNVETEGERTSFL